MGERQIRHISLLAAITSAWSLAKQLGEDFSWKFFQELVVKANYRLDMNLLDSLYKKYTEACDEKVSCVCAAFEIELYLRISVLLIFACGILCGWILGRGSGPVPSAQFSGHTVGSSPVKELPGRNRKKVGAL